MAIITYPILAHREMTIEEFKAWLKQFDYDNDGKISRDELQQAMQSMNAWLAWWKARQALKEADTNKNGVIDVEEMNKLVGYAQRRLHMKIFDLVRG